jgi:hypothetical protein
LAQLAELFHVPADFFFQGAPKDRAIAPDGFGEASAPYVVDSHPLIGSKLTPETRHLNEAFTRIRNPKIRKRILDLVSAIADGEDQA